MPAVESETFIPELDSELAREERELENLLARIRAARAELGGVPESSPAPGPRPARVRVRARAARARRDSSDLSLEAVRKAIEFYRQPFPAPFTTMELATRLRVAPQEVRASLDALLDYGEVTRDTGTTPVSWMPARPLNRGEGNGDAG